MQVILHPMPAGGSFHELTLLPRQELVHDWYGADVTPPLEFAMASDGSSLWVLASRACDGQAQPGSEKGKCYHAPLCDYDVAEFFIADAEEPRYFEFHLAPNGAWWYGFFQNVREADATLSAIAPEGVEMETQPREGGWLVMARIPLGEIRGLDLAHSRIAMTSILESPQYIYLTTADRLDGTPDFHRPADWAMPLLRPGIPGLSGPQA